MFSTSPASMSSSAASAFGSPLSIGQTPTGFPSPFPKPTTISSPFIRGSITPYSTNASSSPGTGFGFTTASGQASMPWGSTLSGDQNSFTGFTPYSPTPATNASSSPGTGFGFTTASGQASMPWGSTLSGDQNSFTGGGVVPAFAGNRSTGLKPIFPSVPSNPFATPSRGPVPPSVPSNPFATTPPSIGQFSFMNHVKPNLEPVLDKMEEWEKSTQLICKDVKHFQEDMKSWIIERDRSLEMATQTINQLREELARVTRFKEAIIAEYLASPDFTKRLDEEHEKRLSKIFHPCYVKALGEVQTKFPETNSFTFQRPATGWFPPSAVTTLFSGHNPNSGHA